MSTELNPSALSHYTQLQPDIILDAIESLGLYPRASLLALNSYENRVYQVAMEEGSPLVVKFYRPERWSDEQILEEHGFCFELQDFEIPVVVPMQFNGTSLHNFMGYRFALFESRGGRNLEVENNEHLTLMGRLLARIHLVGESRLFKLRPNVNVDTYGWESLKTVLSSGYIPHGLELPYQTIAKQLCMACERIFNEVGELDLLRLHADCHPANVMWTDCNAHFVDFDDARNGPAIQDLWMMVTGEGEQLTKAFDALMDGYQDFRDFDRREVRLIEPFRALRMLHYTSWLCQRWVDPSFKHNFPWFITQQYWEEQILMLKEQLFLIDNPPLKSISVNLGNSW